MNLQVSFSGSPARWIRIAILNLMVVALAGVFSRYKLTYSLPQIDFNNLVNAHSHFAFTAWVSTALFAVLAAFFLNPQQQESKPYSRLFLFNQISSYGMLISFLLQDYGAFSIAFSALSVLVSYGYVFLFWRDTRSNSHLLSVKALRFSLICLVASSFGPYALLYMKSMHLFNLVNYKNAIYWYLHFQYNGWFSFAVFSLAIHSIENAFSENQFIKFKTFLSLMKWAIIPLYLASILWSLPANWIFGIAGMGGFFQLIAVILLWHEVIGRRKEVKVLMKEPGGWLLLISFLSVTIKLVLQFFCIFPELNKFVFGYRPVIIGYLHLVLIGFVSFFIIGICIRHGVMSYKRKIAGAGLVIFILGFIVTEFALLLHGINTMTMSPVPGLPLVLFIAALTMLSGIILFALPQEKFKLQSDLKKDSTADLEKTKVEDDQIMVN